jgi:5-methylcytosine-specific restriction protein B
MGLNSSMVESDREALWTSFLERWPLERLGEMTLEEYVQVKSRDTFTYWLETKTSTLGSIAGGSAFKFGVFSREGRGEGENLVGRSYTSEYAWYSKYGDTPENAFRNVRNIVVSVAEAARRGDLHAVEAADFGSGIKWKIAFLYQDRRAITILPIFKKEHLNTWLQNNPPIDSMVELQRAIAARRGNAPVFEFASSVWHTANERLKEESSSTRSQMSPPSMKPARPPLNQILLGPPGTGKTFHCVTEALRIIDPAWLEEHQRDRARLKARFDELVRDGRIRLVTFHQSFSYEDFVEGIRAKTDEKNSSVVTYSTERGVFTKLCDDARLSASVRERTGVNQNAKVWKLSIGRRQDTAIREACFKRGEARIGWGYVGDLSDPGRGEQQIRAFEREGDTNQHSLMTFYEGMSKGDVVLCLRSQSSIEAVGVVQSDYAFDPSNPELWTDYFHVRKVNWLATGLDVDIVKLNGGVNLTQKTIYELPRIAAADALALVPDRVASGQEMLPYVLIIDEINRGNIAKIFGELITLLEPSKRAGAPEALEVELPYSKTPFSVPSNVYVIGTMNTADRSLATLDIALRRRFTFVEMPPRPEELAEVSVHGVNIGEMLKVMNQRIEVLLDRDHALGHAYFLPLKNEPTLEHLATIFRNQILPLLQEYFFEDWQRIGWVLNDHRKQSESHRFLLRPDYDVKQLLGQESGMPGESRHWRINESAFAAVESFSGIIEA